MCCATFVFDLLVIHIIMQREQGVLSTSVLLLPGAACRLPPAAPAAAPPAPPLSDSHVGERQQLLRDQQLRQVLLPHATLHQRPTAHLIRN